jgi:hypothetical protein
MMHHTKPQQGVAELVLDIPKSRICWQSYEKLHNAPTDSTIGVGDPIPCGTLNNPLCPHFMLSAHSLVCKELLP